MKNKDNFNILKGFVLTLKLTINVSSLFNIDNKKNNN